MLASPPAGVLGGHLQVFLAEDYLQPHLWCRGKRSVGPSSALPVCLCPLAVGQPGFRLFEEEVAVSTSGGLVGDGVRDLVGRQAGRIPCDQRLHALHCAVRGSGRCR